MNILWIEDFGRLDHGTTTLQLMFGDLLNFDRWDEDELSLLDKPNDLEEFCKKNSPEHCIYLCRHFFDYQDFKENHDFIKTIDLAIIDIRLNNKVCFDKPVPAALPNKAKFHEEAGFFIFNDLAHAGFPVEKMCFMTGEKNSLTSFEAKCAEIYIQGVIGFEKTEAEYPKLREWIKGQFTDYKVLRRGVVEGCQYAKCLVKENLYFNNFTPKQDSIQQEDLVSYFEILENFLPLREPENKKTVYKLFIRTLSPEWEAAKNIRNDKEKPDAVLAWIMRNTRHWITHNSSLFSHADEQLLAFLFMVNLRVMFSHADYSVKKHENILLKLFDNESLSTEDFNRQNIPVSEAYLTLRNIIRDENQNPERKNLNIEEAFYFNEMANNVQVSKSPLRNDKKFFEKLLYQMFWLTTCNPFVDRKNNKSLEIKFWNFNYSDKPYMLAIAKSIYHRSFPCSFLEK